MRSAQVAPMVDAAERERENVVDGERITEASGVAAEPAGPLLDQHLLAQAPVAGAMPLPPMAPSPTRPPGTSARALTAGSSPTPRTRRGSSPSSLTARCSTQRSSARSGRATPAAAAAPSSTSAAAQATASNQTSSTPSTATASPWSYSTGGRPTRLPTLAPQRRQTVSTAPANRPVPAYSAEHLAASASVLT
jgi:hypothetical protein